MKNFNHIYKSLLICLLGILITGCEVEDGAQGPAGQDGIDGIDGVDGIDGTNGNNGANGIDGEGFNELTKFGSITLSLEGIRPDDIPFTNNNIFKFTPISPNILPLSNSVLATDSGFEFRFGRFVSAPDDDFLESGVTIILNVTNPGTVDQEFSFDMRINKYAVISDDLTFFGLSNFPNGIDGSELGFTDVDITNFEFNNETNNLTFSYSLTVSGENNTSNNDLLVSGEVNVILIKINETPIPL